MGLIYCLQGRYGESEEHYRRSLEIREEALGEGHYLVGKTLNNLGNVYYEQERYEEAEPLYLRSLAIKEAFLRSLAANEGAGEYFDPSFGKTLYNLAALYHVQDLYEKARPLYLRSLEMLEMTVGEDHPDFQKVERRYAKLLRATGHEVEASELPSGIGLLVLTLAAYKAGRGEIRSFGWVFLIVGVFDLALIVPGSYSSEVVVTDERMYQVVRSGTKEVVFSKVDTVSRRFNGRVVIWTLYKEDKLLDDVRLPDLWSIAESRLFEILAERGIEVEIADDTERQVMPP